ncbi:MAG: di-heme oxidoredictase family protein [Candidatus Solibacter sp.]
MTTRFSTLLAGALIIGTTIGSLPLAAQTSPIGREVSIPRHWQDDEEFKYSIPDIVAYGKKLFDANWTGQEGAGRPLTKGTGLPLADPSQPLSGLRAFNRVSAPDANSCTGCHNLPYGISGGGGDFVANVFVLAQRFDFVSFDGKDTQPTKGSASEKREQSTLQDIGNSRASTGMFGSGYLEMLARQMTAELQQIRGTLKHGETKDLIAKGVHFGKITLTRDGLWDISKVEGLPRPSLLSTGTNDPPTLVIRPWHQSGNVVSLREFTNNALNQHHGIQSTERFGLDTDPDGDGVKNEMTRADVTALAVFQATMQTPGRVIPNDPAIEAAVLLGEKTFEKVRCAVCHVPSLPLEKSGWAFTEPGPYNPPGNLRLGYAKTLSVDLTSPLLPQPRLTPARADSAVIDVPAYTDFKLHDICEPDDPGEPLNQNFPAWSPMFVKGNRKFLTKRLWGAANEPPYFHHGLFTTMRQAVLAHDGEAKESREAFQKLTPYEQDSLIEFLKTLQVLPPGTKDLIVDENYKPKHWPPPASKQVPTGNE